MLKNRHESIQTCTGTILWHGNYGVPDCEEAPAIILPNGDKEWWKDGRLHRCDGPAIERADGSCEWWRDGQPWKSGPIESSVYLQEKISRKNLETLKMRALQLKVPKLK